MSSNPESIESYVPGPVDVRRQVLEAMAEPPHPHRTELIQPKIASIKKNLLALVGADESTHSAVVTGGSGRGAMEMAARNWSSAADDKPKVLIASIGDFGDLWVDVYMRNDCKVEVMSKDAGEVIDSDELAEKLNSGYPYEIVALTHNETSTGTTNPLDKIAPVVKRSGAMLFVDGVSSVGGIEVDVKKWGIDFLAIAPQKALGVPPGLALAVVSNRALEAVSNTNRGHTSDVMCHLEAHEKNFTLATPPEAQIGALAVQLAYIVEEEGLEARLDRHKYMAAYTRNWAKFEGFELLPEEANSSDTVSCLVSTSSLDLEVLQQQMRANWPVQYEFDPGYSKLNEARNAAGLPSTFRIAHMADRDPEQLARYLETITEYLK